MASDVLLQQVFIADDLHGKAGADQRAKDRLRRADHDALTGTIRGSSRESIPVCFSRS